ncbi:MAG: aldo/keto reductase [Candidatus Hydrogenedentes bacterium]|nr:aldo/keto reductase [Candidatus Hydrogenedentota bacterium]
MTDRYHSVELDRRRFMQVSAAAAAGVVTASASAVPAPGKTLSNTRNEREGMPYRVLGRTGFRASRLVFGCGAALMGGKAVRLLERAYEAGVNFYDVGSDVYYKGSEHALAPFLKAHREEVWVTSKAPLSIIDEHKEGEPLNAKQAKHAAEYWTKLLDRSLKDLEQDYVDAYYLMAVGDPALVECEALHEAFLKAKEAGKVGHFGISTHKRAQQCLASAVKTGWYDLAMIAITPAGWYDWDSKSLLEGTAAMKDIQPELDAAKKAGMGLIGMKAGRYLAPKMAALGNGEETAFDTFYDQKFLESGLNPYQRSYAYVLEHGIDAVNADMQNFKHFEENLHAAVNSHTYFAQA